MFDIIREAYCIAKDKRKKKRDAAERAAIAQAFNDRYTYRLRYAADGNDYAWMCGDCNKIHRPDSFCFLGGLQYPACCRTGEGNRLYHGIRTS